MPQTGTPELAIAGERFALIESNYRCWGPNGGFRMGVAGWRFAHFKRNRNGRATVVAVLEELPAICSLAVAAGSMIMVGIMLYKDWPQ
jgi:hypothetical protein